LKYADLVRFFDLTGHTPLLVVMPRAATVGSRG
jgi:hypothetical protein